jgi:hypothetical protein
VAISGCACEAEAQAASCDTSLCGKKQTKFDKQMAKILQLTTDAGVLLALGEENKALRKLRRAERKELRLPKKASRQCEADFDCYVDSSVLVGNCLQEAQARVSEEKIDPNP